MAKKTGPDIKIVTGQGNTRKYDLQRDSDRMDRKMANRGAATPWAPIGRAKVVSKGSTDVPGTPISKRKRTIQTDESEA